MKTIIIEDEPLVARDLRNLILQIDPSIEVIATLDSLESSVAYLKSHEEPDLIFMDIQLNDGVSFDLFKRVEVKTPIIFTTAYNEYALRAFKVNSIDYLLKPIDKNELRSAIEKYKRINHGDGYLKDQLEQAVIQLSNPSKKMYKERFMVHSGKSYSVINYSNIGYFVKDTLVYLVTNDKQQFLTDFETMEEVEDLLDPKFFYRANRQYIININAVDSFRSDVYGKMVVQLKQPLVVSIDISREKAQAFKNWIQ
jgi:two-component system, LytTR family, response regulator